MRWLRSTKPAAEPPSGAKRFLLAQVSDIHFMVGGDTAAAFARCVAHLARLPQQPDAVIFTGGLADSGSAAEYEAFGKVLAPLKMPTFLMAGSYDDPDAMRAAFPSHGYLPRGGNRIDYVIDEFPLRIVALDSTVPKQRAGALHLSQIEWLDETLKAATQKPTIVALHHPPYFTGIGHVDKDGLARPEWVEGVIAEHAQVERVICGHLHRATVKRFGNTVASTCPSASFQVALELDDAAAPKSVGEAPGFQLHLWQRGSGLVSHTAALEAS